MAVTRSNDGESQARGAAIQHAGEQGLLFGDETLTVHSDDVGYRGPTACAAAGITYRQLDYWARTGLVEPSVRAIRRRYCWLPPHLPPTRELSTLGTRFAR